MVSAAKQMSIVSGSTWREGRALAVTKAGSPLSTAAIAKKHVEPAGGLFGAGLSMAAQVMQRGRKSQSQQRKKKQHSQCGPM